MPETSQKLHKILAQAGLGSRREMEQWVRDGRVIVNGAVANIGLRVSASDRIKVGARLVRWPAHEALPRVLLYHKPEGEIVTRDDPEGRATVFAKLPRLRGAKWVAVGRLDFNTSGLLMFTDSGALANRMMHPRFEIEREYAVRVRGQLHERQITTLKSGIALADGAARCESVLDAGGEGVNRWYRVVLREGRNRIVRRMFEQMGLTISRLIRVRFGIVKLPPQLRRGRSREMTAVEAQQLLDWLKAPAETAKSSVVPESARKRSRPRHWSRAR